MWREEEQVESITFQALDSYIRRTIIRILMSKNHGASYTELITELGLSTGKLNYHLEQLKGLIEKNNERSYVLTSLGKKAAAQLDLIEKSISSEDEKYVKIAALSQKTSLQPIVKAMIAIGIVMIGLIISIWGYLTYIAVIEGAPPIAFILLPVLIAVGSCFLATLVYAWVKTPSWIKRFEQKRFGDS